MKKIRILLLENIHTLAKKNLEDAGFEVDLLTYSPAKDELIELLKKYDAVGIRSKTKMTEEVLKNCSHLLAIGCFCIGTNQVDLNAAKKLGIAVFNAPHSNTRSVAELVIAEMIALSRQLGDRNTNAHLGVWQKSAKGSNEIRSKTLGIIGYGHIGSQVSVLAEAMGLKVIFYDIIKKLPLGNATQVELDFLLEQSDYVTLHVPGLPSTQNMMTKVELSKMKKGAHLINASRGSVVVINDLVEHLKNGHLAGCAIDVFPSEPSSNDEKFTSELQGLSNVILTPHIGGSTEEAQESIGNEVSESLLKFIKAGSSMGSVNFPAVDAPLRPSSRRLINIHENKPGVLSQINNLISNSGINIDGQYLATDESIGYLLMDVNNDQVESLADEIKNLDPSILTRITY